MEIKAELVFPYTEDERVDFIIEQNHNNGYEIREVAHEETENVDLQAWGYTEEEIEERRRETIGKLTLTRGDVFAGLIQARMIDEAALAVIVDQMPEETAEEKMTKMLSKNALSNALNFHRNHPMVASIGSQLGISEQNLDKFFETNDFHFLLEETEGNRK